MSKLAGGYLFGGIAAVICMALHLSWYGTLIGIIAGAGMIQIGGNKR